MAVDRTLCAGRSTLLVYRWVTRKLSRIVLANPDESGSYNGRNHRSNADNQLWQGCQLYGDSYWNKRLSVPLRHNNRQHHALIAGLKLLSTMALRKPIWLL